MSCYFEIQILDRFGFGNAYPVSKVYAMQRLASVTVNLQF